MGNQEWETPPDFWAVLNEEFDFQLDAAASSDNTKCYHYYSKDDNALSPDRPWVAYGARSTDGLVEVGWQLRVYCNPGFRDMMPWVKKCYAEAQKHPDALVGLVGPLSAAKWFAFCVKNADEIRILTPRIQFVAPPGVKQSSNSKDNVLIVFRQKTMPCPAIITVWPWREKLTALQKQPKGFK